MALRVGKAENSRVRRSCRNAVTLRIQEDLVVLESSNVLEVTKSRTINYLNPG